VKNTLLGLLGICVALLLAARGLAVERPNVLLICNDDLRPELACFGQSHIHSPHIDRQFVHDMLQQMMDIYDRA